MSEKKQRVVVLMGGPSSEYEISLATGKNIMKSLDPERYLAWPVIVTKERRWLMPHWRVPLASPIYSNVLQNIGIDESGLVPFEEERAINELGEAKPDVMFVAMHGEFGEDGTVQGLLDALGIPYTGSGVLASALGMDKPRSLAVFRDAGLQVPDFFVISREEWKNAGEDISTRAEKLFQLPVVVKPADRGSSVGVTIARDTPSIEVGIAEALRHSDRAILQQYISGIEVSAGVLEINGKAQALPPTEIVPVGSSFFDYHAKYTPGASEEITPARLPQETIGRIQDSAIAAHHALGCSGVSRTDMIVDASGGLWILETNTLPGLSEASILPKQAAAGGITFPKLLDTIVESALRKKAP
jgi:D-alanine-D-alanine ligase